jgi:ribokinase
VVIDASYLFRASSVDTGAALIHVDATAHKQILVAPGANACLTAQDVAAAASPLKRSRILMVQLEVPLEAVEAGVKLAAEAGVKVLLDPAPPRNVSDELLAMVDVLRPDAKEAEALTGIAVRDRASAQRAAEHLLERGVRLVAVQAGDEGNLLAWQNGSYFVPLLQLDHRVDATGAGDAFAAALAVSLVEGRPRESAAWFANAAAALTTTVLGAYPALPRRDAVDKLMAEHADTSGLRMLG